MFYSGRHSVALVSLYSRTFGDKVPDAPARKAAMGGRQGRRADQGLERLRDAIAEVFQADRAGTEGAGRSTAAPPT